MWGVASWQAGRQAGWLTGWLASWLAGWLAGWLSPWLNFALNSGCLYWQNSILSSLLKPGLTPCLYLWLVFVFTLLWFVDVVFVFTLLKLGLTRLDTA